MRVRGLIIKSSTALKEERSKSQPKRSSMFHDRFPLLSSSLLSSPLLSFPLSSPPPLGLLCSRLPYPPTHRSTAAFPSASPSVRSAQGHSGRQPPTGAADVLAHATALTPTPLPRSWLQPWRAPRQELARPQQHVRRWPVLSAPCLCPVAHKLTDPPTPAAPPQQRLHQLHDALCRPNGPDVVPCARARRRLLAVGGLALFQPASALRRPGRGPAEARFAALTRGARPVTPVAPRSYYFLTVDAIGADGTLRKFIVDKAQGMRTNVTRDNFLLHASHSHRCAVPARGSGLAIRAIPGAVALALPAPLHWRPTPLSKHPPTAAARVPSAPTLCGWRPRRRTCWCPSCRTCWPRPPPLR